MKKFLNKRQIFNNKYPYISSTSKNLIKHFKIIYKNIDLKGKKFVLEIGSNDGSFLKF